MPLPLLAGRRFVTDGGLETDLIFHYGVDLPEFAAYPLLRRPEGRALLTRYYTGYAAVATAAGAGLLLETPTWRSNPDWGARLGDDGASLRRVNADAVTFLHDMRDVLVAGSGVRGPVLVSGVVGPRGDGYRSDGSVDAGAARDYHLPQLEAFAAAGADLVTAYTLTEVGEAIGVVAAAREVGLPVATSFTVETDGRLARGQTLEDAVREVDDEGGGPDGYLVNCAHPRHVAAALEVQGDWVARVVGLRVNASTKSHAELDEATELDDGDVTRLAGEVHRLVGHLPELAVLGGCCGTDVRHVAAMWGVATPD